MLKTILVSAGVVLFFMGLVINTSPVPFAVTIAGAALLIAAAVLDWSGGRSRKKKLQRQLTALREYSFPATVRRVFSRENPNLTAAQEDLAFEGLKQYFALMLLERDAGRRGSLGMPSVLVDEAWHSFVLCTEDYALFCRKFFGRMVHHYPDPGARPGRLRGDTVFKDDVLNTWTAVARGRESHPEHFTTMNNTPLLFALDGYASPVNGWIWTDSALSALSRQAEQHQETERKTESRSNSDSSTNSGSSCGGACYTSAPSFGASHSASSSSMSSSSKSSSSRHSDDGGSSCSSRSSGSSCSTKSTGSSCGSSCKSDTSSSSSGSSCGSSCGGGGSSCGGGD